MSREVRDIICAHMTVLYFLHSKAAAEAYFQEVCHSAYSLAMYGDRELYHPYSFAKLVSVIRNRINTQEQQEQEDEC